MHSAVGVNRVRPSGSLTNFSIEEAPLVEAIGEKSADAAAAAPTIVEAARRFAEGASERHADETKRSVRRPSGSTK